jgi:hypothetical protein
MPPSDIANVDVDEILDKLSTEEAVNLIVGVGPCINMNSIATPFHSYSTREQPFYSNRKVHKDMTGSSLESKSTLNLVTVASGNITSRRHHVISKQPPEHLQVTEALFLNLPAMNQR